MKISVFQQRDFSSCVYFLLMQPEKKEPETAEISCLGFSYVV